MTLAPPQDQAARTALAARLNDPAVVTSLMTLLDHADLLAILVTALDGFISRSDVIGDNLIDGITELRGVAAGTANPLAGIDTTALLAAGTSLATALPQAVPSLVALVESGSLEQLAALTDGLADGAQAFETNPIEIGGPLSLLRLLRDPDITRAISYGATVARSLGKTLDPTRSPTPR